MATKMKRGETAEWAIGDDDKVLVRPMKAGPFVCLALHDDNLANTTVLTPAQAESIGRGLIAAAKTVAAAAAPKTKRERKLVLVDERTKEPLTKGQDVTCHDGEVGILTDWREPRDPKNSLFQGARVYVRLPKRAYTSEFFPGVIGAKFVWK